MNLMQSTVIFHTNEILTIHHVFVFFPKTGLVKTHLLFWLLFPPRLGVFGFCPASYTPLSPEVENKLIACRAEIWLVGGVLVEPN